MKLNVTLLLALILLVQVCLGQIKPLSKKFSLPEKVTSSDYNKGMLLAKIKPEFRGLLKESSGSAKLTGMMPGVIRMRSIANPKLANDQRSRQGPRIANKSGVDIELYVRIFLDAGQDIEQAINKLYSSGYFELIEPSYVAKMSFTPDDPSRSNQYYLNLIKAYDAWDITQGDEETVIAIIDSGGDLDHPDLVNNLYTNPDEIPNNGVDDDDDGFIDNMQGWDFMGADTLNAFDSDFVGDNNPQLMQAGSAGNLSHGVWVAGCASASTNNGIGISGVGFNSKLLFTKHTADNQKINSLSIFFGYDGILYAAETLTADNIPRKIINCSWGGAFGSQIAQDIIAYVTLDLGCLVVAASGNDNSSALHYPSSYQHVLSVAATDQGDQRASFSNYGTTVDVTAPGVSILTTGYNDILSTVQGTSFSCPIVAGAAALVWSNYPDLSPLQVAEKLRISADNIDLINPIFTELLGNGRINLQTALTVDLPSVRASNPRLLNASGNAPELGQESFFYLDFTNYLKSTSNGLTVTASANSGFVTFVTNQITLGVIEEGSTITNSFDPIKLTVSANTPENTLVRLKLSYNDGAYTDFQFIELTINPSYLNIDDNQITTSIASKGRLGYDDPDNQGRGVGFVFNDNSILFEMGLIMGTSSTSIFNNVRGINGIFDQDFSRITPIKEIVPGERSSAEVFGSFSPSALNSLLISYRSMVWRDAPNDKFVIIEYTLKNNGSSALSDFRFGIFADWDISGSGAQDAANWNEDNQIGYVYPKQSSSLPHAGIQLLNRQASYYAIDNNQNIAGTPFGLYDGYTDNEKFISLSQERLVAGESTAEGNDVSHVVSVEPVTIEPGEEVAIAFALHAGNNLTELLASAQAASTLYNQTLTAPQPEVASTATCFGDGATLNATGAGSFNWYTSFTDGEPIFSGPSFTTGNLFSDTVFYVSNADQPYESVRTIADISVKANPEVVTSRSPNLCEGDVIIISVADADEYLWSNGATTKTIEVSQAGEYSVTVKDNTLDCESTSDNVVVIVAPGPTAAFSSEAESISNTPVIFTDESTDAISWFWQFGDGSTSTQQNPTHQYAEGGDYQVTLTVTAANGCQENITNPITIITSAEKELEAAISVFPNPAKENIYIKAEGLSSPYFTIQLMNAQGQAVYEVQKEGVNGKMNYTISTQALPQGFYFVKISNQGSSIVRKVIKVN